MTMDHLIDMAYRCMMREADLSTDLVYRYKLVRDWSGVESKRTRVYLMLNPSTADHLVDDATIKRCIYYAVRDGYSRLVVVNLFAFRATDPTVLRKARAHDYDVVGPCNTQAIREALNELDPTDPLAHIAAFGSAAWAISRVRAVGGLVQSRSWMRICPKGSTAWPPHPLYKPNNAVLVPFDWSKFLL